MMEFGFEFYSWIKWIGDNQGPMVFIVSFGMLLVIVVIALFRAFLKKIGLRKITGVRLWNDLMVSLGVTGAIGFLIFVFLLIANSMSGRDSDADNYIMGVRCVLIFAAVFIVVLFFCVTNSRILSKWSDDYLGDEAREKRRRAKGGKGEKR